MPTVPPLATWPWAGELADLVLELRGDPQFHDFLRLQLTASGVQPQAESPAVSQNPLSDDVEMIDVHKTGSSDSNQQDPDRPQVEEYAERFLFFAKEYQRLSLLGDEMGAARYIQQARVSHDLCGDTFGQIWRCLAGPAAWDPTLMDDAMDLISFDRFWVSESSCHGKLVERQPNVGLGPVFSYVEESADGGNLFVRGFTVETMQLVLERTAQLNERQPLMHHPVSAATIPAEAWKRAEAVIFLLALQGKIASHIEVEDPMTPKLPLTFVKISQMALAIFQRFTFKSIFIDSQTRFMALRREDLWLLLAILLELCDTHLCGCMMTSPSFRNPPRNPSTIELQHYILAEVLAATRERILSEPLNGLSKEAVEKLNMSIVEIALKAVNGEAWGRSQFTPTIHKALRCYRMPCSHRRRLLINCS